MGITYDMVPEYRDLLPQISRAEREEPFDPEEGLQWAFPARPRRFQDLPDWQLLEMASKSSEARAEIAHRVLSNPEFREAAQNLDSLAARAGCEVAAFMAEAIWVAIKRAKCRSVTGLARYAARVLRTLVGEDLWCSRSAKSRTREVALETDQVPDLSDYFSEGDWPPPWDVGRGGRQEIVRMALEALRAGAYGEEGLKAAAAVEHFLEKGTFGLENMSGLEMTGVLNTIEQALLDAVDAYREEHPEFRLADIVREEVLKVFDAFEQLAL